MKDEEQLYVDVMLSKNFNYYYLHLAIWGKNNMIHGKLW